MDKQFNEVIVGFGGMGNWHRELIESGIDNLHLKGVYDIAEAPCRKAKEMGYHVYESLDAVLADPEVDIVLCATPLNTGGGRSYRLIGRRSPGISPGWTCWWCQF